jgi:hypothetical protein
MVIVVLYFIVLVAYIACFTAFMDSKREDKKYWDKYGSIFDDSWKLEYCFMMVFGALFWPLSIPGYLFYRFVYKQAEKFFTK